MTVRPTLPEPVEIAKFWKNRRHDAVVVSLSTYEGRNIVDVRTHTINNGRLVPTVKGVAIVVLRLAVGTTGVSVAISW
jgi:hypothetical protein